MRPEFQPENHPPWRGLYPKASLFIFACGRNFSPKTIRLGGEKASLFIFACGRNFSLKIIRLGGDFIRKLLVYFRLRPDFRPENGRINRNEKLIFNS